jgi:DNA-binding transcriptional LysR family regulator
MLGRLGKDEVCPTQIRVDRPIEEIEITLCDRRQSQNACVIDDNVDLSVLLLGFREEICNVFRLRYITLQRECVATICGDFVDHFLRLGCVACIVDDDGEAVLRETLCNDSSDRLLQELEVIFPRLDRLISGGDFDPSLEVASFRIAVTDYAASVFAPLVCRTILPAAKGVSFEFATWRSDRFDRLSHGSLDLVLDADAVRVPSPLQKTELHEEEFVCVVDAEHIRGNRLSLKQYLDGDHVGVSTLEGKQTLPDDRLASVGHQRNVVVKVPYFVAAIEAVAGTKLIATVPRRFALLCAKDKRLGLLSPPNIFQPFKYVMIWHPRVNTDAAHIWLRRTVQNLGKLLDAEKKAK